MPYLLATQPCFTFDELISLGFSENTIKLEFPSLPDPRDARYSLYPYDLIARRSRKSASKLPPREQVVQEALVQVKAAQDAELLIRKQRLAECWMTCYKVNDVNAYIEKGYSDSKAKGLAKSIATLRWLDKMRLPKRMLLDKTDFISREDLLKTSAELIAELNLPHLPTSYQRLRCKVDEYRKYTLDKRNEDLDFIISKKGNTNAQVIGKPTNTDEDNLLDNSRINIAEWHASMLITLAMNPGKSNKFDWEEVHKRYTIACKKEGKDPQSISAIKRFLNLNEVKMVWTWERDGFDAFDKLLPHVHGRRPDYSLRKGGIDGFQVDFYTQDKGVTVMLTCVPVFDYASEAITGFDIGHVETGLLVRNAYRNHLRLHGGKTFFELDMDGAAANMSGRTKEMFARLVSKVRVGMSDDPTYKHRSNSKERFSERLIQELNRYAQSLESWKGTNITSHDIKRKPNPDYAKKYQTTLEDGFRQVVELIKVYNNTPLKKYNGKSRIQQFEALQDPDAEIIDDITQSQLFNWRTVVTLRGDVVKVQVGKVDYEYYVKDVNAWMPKLDNSRRVAVYYDEDDMAEVHCFGWELDQNGNPHESFLASLKLGERAYRDIASMSDADKELIADQVAKRKKVMSGARRKALEAEAHALGIDPSEYPHINDLEAAVKGMREQSKLVLTFAERHAEALQQPEAVRMSDFYNDHYASKGIRTANEPKAFDEELLKKKMRLYNLDEFND